MHRWAPIYYYSRQNHSSIRVNFSEKIFPKPENKIGSLTGSKLIWARMYVQRDLWGVRYYYTVLSRHDVTFAKNRYTGHGYRTCTEYLLHLLLLYSSYYYYCCTHKTKKGCIYHKQQTAVHMLVNYFLTDKPQTTKHQTPNTAASDLLSRLLPGKTPTEGYGENTNECTYNSLTACVPSIVVQGQREIGPPHFVEWNGW